MARNVSIQQFADLVKDTKQKMNKWGFEKAILQIRHLDYLRFRDIINENKDFLVLDLRDDIPCDITCYLKPLEDKGDDDND